jgi:hypothetical protein
VAARTTPSLHPRLEFRQRGLGARDAPLGVRDAAPQLVHFARGRIRMCVQWRRGDQRCCGARRRGPAAAEGEAHDTLPLLERCWTGWGAAAAAAEDGLGSWLCDGCDDEVLMPTAACSTTAAATPDSEHGLRRRQELHPSGVTSSHRVLDETQAAHARKSFCRFAAGGTAWSAASACVHVVMLVAAHVFSVP